MDSALFDGSTDIAYKVMQRKHVKTIIIITIWQMTSAISKGDLVSILIKGRLCKLWMLKWTSVPI